MLMIAGVCLAFHYEIVTVRKFIDTPKSYDKGAGAKDLDLYRLRYGLDWHFSGGFFCDLESAIDL